MSIFDTPLVQIAGPPPSPRGLIVPVEFTITDAQLQTINTVPVTVLAAQGSGKVVFPFAWLPTTIKAAGAWTSTTSLTIRHGGGDRDLVSNVSLASLTTAGAQQHYMPSPCNAWGATGLPNTVYDPKNKGLVVRGTTDPVKGAGGAASVRGVILYYVLEP